MKLGTLPFLALALVAVMLVSTSSGPFAADTVDATDPIECYGGSCPGPDVITGATPCTSAPLSTNWCDGWALITGTNQSAYTFHSQNSCNATSGSSEPMSIWRNTGGDTWYPNYESRTAYQNSVNGFSNSQIMTSSSAFWVFCP